MDVYGYSPSLVLSLILTIMRVSIVMFMLPVFSTQNIPVLVKAATSLVFSLAVWPHLAFSGADMPLHPFNMGIMLLGEVVMGLVLGLAVNFLFMGIQAGGELLGFQMGFTMMTLADPSSGAQVSITSTVLHMVAMILFLTLDGHLHLLRALDDSFHLVPPGGIRVSGPLAGDMLALSGGMFSLAVKIAAPVIAALLMVELALAFMGLAAPQMNLLTLGFPAKIGVGFFFLGILFSTLSQHLEDIVLSLGPLFDRILGLAGAGPQ